MPDDRMLPPEWDEPTCPGCGSLGNLDFRLTNEPGGDFARYCCSNIKCRVTAYEGGFSPDAPEEPRVFLTDEGEDWVDRKKRDEQVLEVVGKP